MHRLPRTKNNRMQLTEIIDEALKHLPVSIPSFKTAERFSYVPDIRREQRVDANGFKARRSSPNRKWESWVDVQISANETKND